jgi:hypothetical protein
VDVFGLKQCVFDFRFHIGFHSIFGRDLGPVAERGVSDGRHGDVFYRIRFQAQREILLVIAIQLILPLSVENAQNITHVLELLFGFDAHIASVAIVSRHQSSFGHQQLGG